ncbi:hypothetical protein [Halobellus captivus]|uniref:hypothetical protein n=1 Tax=Halobellus captivus TaxID=2592614 RepID=UPI0011A89E59|nr:hypothetical protein [Halobellus captivus]
MNVSQLINENTIATVLVALMAFTGSANGTVAAVVIGGIHMIDVPALIRVIGQEAREGCT